MKYSFLNIIVVLSMSLIGCKKRDITKSNEIVNSQTRSLLKKSLLEIKQEIAGKWQVKRSNFSACGINGCVSIDSIFNNNTGDILSFIENDTVKQTNYFQNIIKIYEKANITKVKTNYGTYNGFPYNVDSVYKYGFVNSPFSSFTMIEIKNDTLVIYGGDVFETYYLIKKQ